MKSCGVEGCERAGRLVRGLCRPHYKRLVRHGDPLGGSVPRQRRVRSCEVEGCEDRHYGHGFCSIHYERWRKHGDPMVVLPAVGPPRRTEPYPPCRIEGCTRLAERHVTKQLCDMHEMRGRRHGYAEWEPPSFEERFWDKVVLMSGCWEWQGARLGGYGYFNNLKAHRVAYELLVGPIPEGLTIDHVCHNEAAARGECGGGVSCTHRACVNPAHLEPVTGAENVRRAVAAKRRAESLGLAA